VSNVKALWGAIAILTLSVFCLGGYLVISSRTYKIEVDSDKAPVIALLRLAEFSVAGCKVNEAVAKSIEGWDRVHDKAITSYCLETVRLNLMRVLREVKRPVNEATRNSEFEELAEKYGGFVTEIYRTERDADSERRVALVSGRLDANLYRRVDLESIAACQYALMREADSLVVSLYIRKEAEKFCLEVFQLRNMVSSQKWKEDPSYYLHKDLEFELSD
jgi:hypothetical protein